MSALEDRAAAMRAAFDRGFAEPPAGAAAASEDFLAIRAGEQRRALRLAEVAGLFAGRRVVPVPSPAAHLLGLAGFRGAILPVYDLRALLGASVAAPPRWLVVAAAAAVAFAFDGFDGHVRVPRGNDVIVASGERRVVLALGALVDELTRGRRVEPTER